MRERGAFRQKGNSKTVERLVASSNDHVATGETHSVREFVEQAFACVGSNYRDHVVIDERFDRPSEVNILLGDSSKARERLGWGNKIGFGALVLEMVRADCEALGVGETVRLEALAASA